MPDLIDREELLRDMTSRFITIADWHYFDCVNEQPTIEAESVNRAAILRLCNEIEEIVTSIANHSTDFRTVTDCRTVCDKLQEIGKELTEDAGTDD